MPTLWSRFSAVEIGAGLVLAAVAAYAFPWSLLPLASASVVVLASLRFGPPERALRWAIAALIAELSIFAVTAVYRGVSQVWFDSAVLLIAAVAIATRPTNAVLYAVAGYQTYSTIKIVGLLTRFEIGTIPHKTCASVFVLRCVLLAMLAIAIRGRKAVRTDPSLPSANG